VGTYILSDCLFCTTKSQTFSIKIGTSFSLAWFPRLCFNTQTIIFFHFHVQSEICQKSCSLYGVYFFCMIGGGMSLLNLCYHVLPVLGIWNTYCGPKPPSFLSVSRLHFLSCKWYEMTSNSRFNGWMGKKKFKFANFVGFVVFHGIWGCELMELLMHQVGSF